ncbi:MAG: hypothetical protein ACI4QS_00575 [Comamonas sp.]
MYLIVIAWGYVTLMMAIAEAASPQGSLLGAAITLLLYGVLPLSILVYILGTPERKRRLRQRREAEHQSWLAQQAKASNAPDAGGHAPGTAKSSGIAPVRKES